MAFDYTHIPAFIAAIKEQDLSTDFLKARYFPDGMNFATDEVLVEYKKGNRKLAPFVAPRVGGVSIKRDGYSAKTFAPGYIAPKRPLTIDELKKKRMGESFYANLSPEDRASSIMLDDVEELDKMITRTENWMAAQLLLTNGVVMLEKTENPDVFSEKEICFYEGATNDWIFTPSTSWADPDADIIGDIAAMCRSQKSKGVAATELLVSANVGTYILNNNAIKDLMDICHYNIGEVDPQLVQYNVAKLAKLNCEGHIVDVLQYVEEYTDDNDVSTPYITDGYAVLLAPNCGHTSYGAVTQLEKDGEWHTYAEKRVPLNTTDLQKQTKELRLASAPLLMPDRANAYLTSRVVF